MIRLTILWGVIAFFSAYAWINWFRSLLVLILLMAVYQHPDMPKSLAGVQGINPWNVLFASVFLAWLASWFQRAPGETWDLPRGTFVLLLLYVGAMLISSTRAILGPSAVDLSITYGSTSALIGELFINTFKWIVPGILLFDGCRDDRRLKEALWCALAVYGLIALQVVKYMPPQHALDGEGLAYRAIRVLQNGVGYHRVNLSVMLAGASWAVFASRVLSTQKWMRLGITTAALMIVYAQAMTAGRAGYVAWGLVGLSLAVVKWRRLLLGIPVVVVAVLMLVPAVSERMLEGFSEDTIDSNRRIEGAGELTGSEVADVYTVTAGRSFMWGFVVDKIRESPWMGYGRLAMQRVGITKTLFEEYNEQFAHPHNAYLEVLLDTGLVGFACVIALFSLILWRGLVLFRDDRNPIFVATGGACLSIVLALMYGAFGSQTFYPREGWVGMWCLIGIVLRVHKDRSRMLSAPAPPETASRPTEKRVLPRWSGKRHDNVSVREPNLPKEVLDGRPRFLPRKPFEPAVGGRDDRVNRPAAQGESFRPPSRPDERPELATAPRGRSFRFSAPVRQGGLTAAKPRGD